MGLTQRLIYLLWTFYWEESFTPHLRDAQITRVWVSRQTEIRMVAQNIFSIIIAGSFLHHRNAYQLKRNVKKAPGNSEVHLITPDL
jgi:hypothetical protein